MKSFKKRSISLLVVLCMLCMSMVNVAFATDASAVDIDVVISGNQAVMTIAIPDGASVAGGKIAFTYDTTYMTLDSAVQGAVSALVMPNTATAGKVIISLANSVNFTGTLMTLTFTLEEGTFEESYITFTEYRLTDENGTTTENLTTGYTPVLDVTCDHSSTSVVTVTEATCGTAGESQTVCDVCGEVISTDVIPATEKHTWGEGVETTPAGCVTEGVTTYTCTVCGATKTEPIPATGHTYECVEAKEATCTEDGYKVYACTGGDDTYTEVIPATGHTADESTVVIKDATCTEAGEKTYICAVCGAEVTEVIEALGHTYDEGVVTKEATYTEEGEITYTCTVCGDTYTEAIPVLTSEAESNESDEIDASEADETTTVDGSSNNDAGDDGDVNYILLALFAVVALAGCVIAKKKVVY